MPKSKKPVKSAAKSAPKAGTKTSAKAKLTAKPTAKKPAVAAKAKPIAAKAKPAPKVAAKATPKAAAPKANKGAAVKATAKGIALKSAGKAPTKVAAKPAKESTKETTKETTKEPKVKAAKTTGEENAKSAKAKKVEPEILAAPESYTEEEIVLTDADGRRYCRVKDCDQAAMVDTYCRYHYLLFWKKIQVRKKILTEGKLERYIEDLTARYPDKYLEMLRKDLRNEKDFMAAIQELEIDDTANENDLEDETASFIEEVRGMSTDTGGGSDRHDDEF